MKWGNSIPCAKDFKHLFTDNKYQLWKKTVCNSFPELLAAFTVAEVKAIQTEKENNAAIQFCFKHPKAYDNFLKRYHFSTFREQLFFSSEKKKLTPLTFFFRELDNDKAQNIPEQAGGNRPKMPWK